MSKAWDGHSDHEMSRPLHCQLLAEASDDNPFSEYIVWLIYRVADTLRACKWVWMILIGSRLANYSVDSQAIRHLKVEYKLVAVTWASSNISSSARTGPSNISVGSVPRRFSPTNLSIARQVRPHISLRLPGLRTSKRSSQRCWSYWETRYLGWWKVSKEPSNFKTFPIDNPIIF